MTPQDFPQPPRILLPFNDDSTLFFAGRMREVLKDSPCRVQTAWLPARSDLSYRQMTAILPEGPDMMMLNDAFAQVTPLQQFDAIVTSRMFPPLRDMLRRAHLRFLADRPCVIAFQGGLDFDPERGFFNRRHADAVFVVPKHNIDAYRAQMETLDTGPQYLGFGHPTFLTPAARTAAAPADPATRRDIYFFAQAISPVSRGGRLHILRMLAAIARANPDRDVWLKLRHLPHENSQHLHRELHSYPDLIETLGRKVPDNLRLTSDSMETVLERAAIGVTCTSTAAVDLIRAGVPTQVYLDYAENYLDPLTDPMRRLFAGSNLIAGLEDVLHLRTQAPDPDWLSTLFCAPDQLAEQVLEALAAFHRRPVAVRTLIPPLDPAGSDAADAPSRRGSRRKDGPEDGPEPDSGAESTFGDLPDSPDNKE